MLKIYNLKPTDLRKREGNIYVIRYCSIAAVKDINHLVKKEIRNEKILIMFILNFLYLSLNDNLENISFM